MEELITKIINKTREICKNDYERPDIEDVVAREAQIKLTENKATGGYKIHHIKFIGFYSQVTVTETEISYKPDHGFACELHTYPNWDAFLNL